MNDQHIFDTWAINSRLNLYLLDAIQEEHLSDRLVSKGRNVAGQFAHIHNVRLMWLAASYPAGLEAVAKIENDTSIDKDKLKTALTRSGESIASLLEHAVENGGRVKGFKPHATAFVGYLIADEAHHRSQIIIALKESGHALDKKVLYGLWEWGSR